MEGIIRKLSDVSSWRGAPMGRREHNGPRDYSGRFYLARVRLDRGGYDEGGAYWGIGAPLYRAESEDGDIYFFLRASDRAGARELVRGYYPAARFFR